MTEAQLQAAIADLCKLLGVWCYHTYDSRRSQPGWPDLVLVGRHVLYRELKSATGRLTSAQTEWGLRLGDAGQDWSVWRPDDLRAGRIQAELMLIR